MSESKRAFPTLLSKFLLIITAVIFSCWHGNEAACREYEKQALLTFKQGLTDPSNRLSSWIGDIDCCKWEGVVCNNVSNHVTGLHLRNPNGPYRLDDEHLQSALTGRLDPSLLHLKQLRFLDISLNDFRGIPIPNFIGSLKSLRYLNLSNAGFAGFIPHQLGNLSNLHTLSLTTDIYLLQVDNLRWLTGFSNLQYLDMNGVDLSEASNWAQVISMIPSLVELRWSGCRLGRISHIPAMVRHIGRVRDDSPES